MKAPKTDLGFVYCWMDITKNKLYVGSHKGNPNDGYICSSKYMMEEYKKRPDDFVRQIIAEGVITDIRWLERRILESANAATDIYFYNRRNANEKWYCTGHTEKTKRKISEAWKNRPDGNPMKGRKHSEETKRKIGLQSAARLHTEETKRKIGLSGLGRKMPAFSESHREGIRKARLGTKMSEETKQKISIKSSMYKHTDEAKQKIANALLGLKRGPQSEEHKEKIRIAKQNKRMINVLD